MIQSDEHIFQMGWNHQLVIGFFNIQSYGLPMSPTNAASTSRFLGKETRAAKGGVGAKGSVKRVSWRFVWCEQVWSFGTKKGKSLKRDISSSEPDS